MYSSNIYVVVNCNLLLDFAFLLLQLGLGLVQRGVEA